MSLQDQIDDLKKLLESKTAARDDAEKEIKLITQKLTELVTIAQEIEQDEIKKTAERQEALYTFLYTVKAGDVTFSDMQQFASTLGLEVSNDFREPDEPEPEEPASDAA